MSEPILHFTKQDLEQELERGSFPIHFDFGASTAGYQVEGGINGEQDPKNNWYWQEQSNKAQTVGDCCQFYTRYEEDFKNAQAMHLNSFRMGIEWCRLQPAINPEQTSPPAFSHEAADHYAAIIAKSYEYGLKPAVTMQHFTHPLWAGIDFWLNLDNVKEWFQAYIEFAVLEINKQLISKYNTKPIPYYITLNEPFMPPFATYLMGIFPTNTKFSTKKAMACLEGILVAHVIAYRTIHRIYQEQGWDSPIVTINTWCSASYTMDRIIHDLMLVRTHNVSKHDLPKWIDNNRKSFNTLIRPLQHRGGPQFIKRGIENFIDNHFFKHFKKHGFKNLIDLIYEGSNDTLLDAVSFDYYDPLLANMLQFGFPMPLKINAKPWQWTLQPEHLGAYLDSYASVSQDLPIHILENGMSYRHTGKKFIPRKDGFTPSWLIKSMLYEILKAHNKGIKIESYYYWSLIDNYEWGSYQPRFGLHGIDYHNNACRLSSDIAGNDSAKDYGNIVQAILQGEKQTILQSFFPEARYKDKQA